MRHESSSSYFRDNHRYNIEKKRNFFKAENALACSGYDTIFVEIKRNGKMVKLWRIHNGQEFQISADSLSIFSLKERMELLKY
jgi:hypothetical protein